MTVTKAFPIYKVTTGGQQTGPTVDITYTNLGTILTVTPRISGKNDITLKVEPEVSNIDAIDRQTVAGLVNTANIYAIRKIQTQVVIPSGNTLVMGGLISDNTLKSSTKVPILGDLPGFGLLFRRDAKQRQKQNLIIFITPKIVEADDYQPTESTFLKTQRVERPEPKESAWESGKPRNWTKPVE